MPVLIDCDRCQRKVRVQEANLGKKVRCPACGHTFLAHWESDPEDATAPEDAQEATRRGGSRQAESDDDAYAVQREVRRVRPRRRPVSDGYDEDEDRPQLRPHRGALILTLGILSLIFSCIPLAGWILGAFAMSMGSADERLMEERLMRRSGRGMTKAGQICGIIGVFLSTVSFIINVVLFVQRLGAH
jgi:predicted Zn finger-like uncharacterized protein